MKSANQRILMVKSAFITSLALLFTFLPVLGLNSSDLVIWNTPTQAWAAAKAKKGAYTPATGSAEQKAIVEALRKEMASTTNVKMVFKVEYLKVHDCWAWIHALPSSPDGKQKYEDVNALLEKKAGCWQVAEIACTEEGNPDCLGAPDYFKKLMAKFPGAPADIFPPAK
jgi:hypothetical protein